MGTYAGKNKEQQEWLQSKTIISSNNNVLWGSDNTQSYTVQQLLMPPTEASLWEKGNCTVCPLTHNAPNSSGQNSIFKKCGVQPR